MWSIEIDDDKVTIAPYAPWMPNAKDIQNMKGDLLEALTSDFRLMVFHHGMSIDELDA
jgi:hypothetical protein